MKTFSKLRLCGFSAGRIGLPFVQMDELLKNKTFAVHAAAAGGSVTLGTALTYPLDSLKVLIQVGSTPGKPLGVDFVVGTIRAISGYSGLYNGVGWLTIGRTLGIGVRFGIYEMLTAFYRDGREDDYVYISEALMSGFAAGAMESFLSSPFEIIKLRAQVSSASRITRSKSNTGPTNLSAVSHLTSRLLPRFSPDMRAMSSSVGLLSILPSRHANMSDALKEYPWMMTGSGRPAAVSDVRMPSDIISLEGWGALWRGLRSGIVRDSIFGGIFFSTWQLLHQGMLNWKAVGMDPIPRYDKEAGPLSPMAVSLAAGVSGSIAAAASHGFDTSRTRSQCTVLPKYISMERKLLKWSRPGNRFERLTGIHPSDRNLLPRGLWLRMGRCGLASFVIVRSYFFAIDHLVSN